MFNKDVKICDYSKIAVEDNKTLVPGYIEINSDGAFKFFSDDPENYTPYYEGKLINRIEFKRAEKIDIDPRLFLDKSIQVRHFVDEDRMLDWLSNNS